MKRLSPQGDALTLGYALECGFSPAGNLPAKAC